MEQTVGHNGERFNDFWTEMHTQIKRHYSREIIMHEPDKIYRAWRRAIHNLKNKRDDK